MQSGVKDFTHDFTDALHLGNISSSQEGFVVVVNYDLRRAVGDNAPEESSVAAAAVLTVECSVYCRYALR